MDRTCVEPVADPRSVASPAPAGARSGRRGLTFLVLALGISTFSLLQSLIAPVLPLLQTELHTSQNTVTWVLTAYLLSASVFTPILGRVGDIVGKKRVLVGVLAVLAAGSVLAALATSIPVMIVARIVQGVGGGVIPLSFGIVRDEFPPERVVGAIGLLASLLAAGGGVGLVLAGPIVSIFDYHWLFWIPGALVVVAAVATHFIVPESPERGASRASAWPAIPLSGWLVALLLAISKAPSWGWGSGRVVGLLVLALVLGAMWVLLELRSVHPLIDMRMMRLPAVWTTNLVALLFGIGMYAVLGFLPGFVQTESSAGYGFGATVTQSGLILLPLAAMMFLFGALNSRLSVRFGANKVLVAGSAVSIVPYLALAFVHQRVWEVSAAMLLLGAGFGLTFAAMSNIIVESVPSHQTGVASGMNANIRTIGGCFGAAVMAGIVTSTKGFGGLPTEGGYRAGFIVLALATALAAFAGLLIPRTRGAHDARKQEQLAMAHPAVALVAAAPIVGNEPE
jgi:MFS family permease